MDGNKTLTANFESRPSQYCCWPASLENGWKDECHPIGPTYGTVDADMCRGDYGIVQSNSTPPTNIQYCLWDTGCWPITDPNGDKYNEQGEYAGHTNLQDCQLWGTLVNNARGCPNYGTGDTPPPPPPPPGNVPVDIKIPGATVLSSTRQTINSNANRTQEAYRTIVTRRNYLGYNVRIGNWEFSQTFGASPYSQTIPVAAPAGTYTLSTSYLARESRITTRYNGANNPMGSPSEAILSEGWTSTRTSSITLQAGFRYEIDVVNGTVNTLPQ
jgi:hypothetical protein